MASYILKKRYDNHFGLDLKATDLIRPENYVSSMLNAEYRKSGAPNKRKGYQAAAISTGGHGMFTYYKINPTTFADESQIVSVSNKLHKLNTATLTVTYTGSSSSALISIFFYPTDNEYKLTLSEENSIVLTQGLGLGFDEASIYTLADLVTDITAVSNFTAVATGVTTTPAAFLEIVREHDLISSAFVGSANYWSDVNTTVSTPFAGSETNKNASDFENVSFAQLRNVLYISNGYDAVHKYDGQTCYKAGLPSVASLAAAKNATAGNLSSAAYQYRARYVQYDAAGNIIEGNIIDAITHTGGAVASEQMDVTVSNVVAATGFNTNCAIVNGNQAVVTTITVDAGHTMKVGDTAYFYDSVSSSYVTRSVTAIAATTLTVSGAGVTVADNAVISNNLRIGIYRIKNSGTVFYQVAEIPNDSFNATQVYRDNTADASLTVELDIPVTDRSTPPMGKYLTSHQNLLVLSGNRSDQNLVYWSDIDFPEYFPSGSNFEIMDTTAGDVVTGIISSGPYLVVGKKRSMRLMSGTLGDGNYRNDLLTQDVGCMAHHTLTEGDGIVYFWTDKGPYMIVNGQIPVPVGQSATGGGRLEPVLDQEGIIDALLFVKNRAVSINDRLNKRWLTYLPCESTESGNKYANTNSKIYAYDYSRDAWMEWDNMNMAGGVTILNDDFYFSERRYSSFNTTVDHILYRRHKLNDAWDYEDNNEAIEFSYGGQWETLGEPSVYKRAINFRLFSLETTPNSEPVITFVQEKNFVYDVPISTKDLDQITGGYGVSNYGVVGYGEIAEPFFQSSLNRDKCRSIRLKFNNEEHQQNPIITGWEVEYTLPFDYKFKK